MIFLKLHQVMFGTLRRRLIIGVALVHAVMMLLFLWDLTKRQEAMIHERQIEQATALSQMLATSSAGWLASMDLAGMQELAESQQKYPELQFAMLLDRNGRVLAHSDRSKLGLYLHDLPEKAFQTVLNPGPALVDVAAPIHLKERQIGWARVGIGQQLSGRRLAAITRNGAIYALLAIIIGSLMAWFMGRTITSRLYAIQEVIDQIRSGNTDARITLDGTDEAASLGAEFNTLLDHLKQRSAERDRAEEELLKSEGFLKSIVENIPDMVFIKDAEELRFISLNRAAEELLGINREEMIGKNDYDFFPIEQAEHFIRYDRNTLASAPSIDTREEQIQTRRGLKTLNTKKIGILDRSGTPRFLLGISEDISSRKEIEQALIRAREAAERSSRAKSEFLCVISHELRTPLNAVMGGLQLLQMSNLDPDQSEFTKMAFMGAERELSLINKLLELTGIEAGTLQIKRELFSINSVMSSIKLMHEAICRKKGLEFIFHSDKNIPEWMFGDESRITQIVTLLLENAEKFTQQGKLILDVSIFERLEDSIVLEISVSDTGIGIPEQMQNQVFEPFVQADMSDTRSFGGAGMGLTLCKRLVGLMKGRISVESQQGEGSRFIVRLPLEPYSLIPPPSTELKAQSPRSSSRILVVEDDDMNRAVVQMWLKKLGYNVQTASDGSEAVELYSRESFDLIVMDLQMPVMCGQEATKHIRSGDRGKVPVIALTAEACKETMEQMKAEGFDSYLIKPVKLTELQNEIERLLANA